MTLLLAIDDDPGRYDYLRVLLESRARQGVRTPRLVVATCRACVTRTLPHASGVFLDYDLDGIDVCPNCGGYGDVQKGTGFLPDLSRHKFPVVVTSCSAFENRKALVDGLHRGGVVATSIPADSLGVEHAWLGYLWYWRAL